MKPHERRQAQTYPYYKLARWDPLSLTFRDGKRAYPSIEDACLAASDGQGSVPEGRISVVRADGREDIWPCLGTNVFCVEDSSIAGRVVGFEDDGLIVLVADEGGRVHHVPNADIEIQGSGIA